MEYIRKIAQYGLIGVISAIGGASYASRIEKLETPVRGAYAQPERNVAQIGDANSLEGYLFAKNESKVVSEKSYTVGGELGFVGPVPHGKVHASCTNKEAADRSKNKNSKDKKK